jgi:hypothetical protein
MAEMAMSIPSKGYKIEGHNSYGTLYHLDFFHEEDNNNDDVDPTTLVDHKDNQAHWFKSYFLDRDVFTFFGYIADDEPVLISAVTEINENGNKQYRIICRSKKV